MGTFTVKATVRNPNDPTRVAEAECWVDTGALYSQLPRSLLGDLGIASTGTRRVLLADGREEDVNLAEARFQVDGQEATTVVIFGNETAPALLGAVALESLGLGVDPGSKRLVPIVAPMFLISSRIQNKN